MVWIWRTWRPLAKVEVAVTEFGIEKSVVEAAETMFKARRPAVCSSHSVRSADWVEVAVEVPKAERPVCESMEKKGLLLEEEAMWRMGALVVESPWRERRAKGVLVPIPTAVAEEEAIVAPETPQGVFKVSAVPETRNPGVPAKVMPSPADTEEVATEARVFLPVAYVSWFAESSEVVPMPEMVKFVPPTRKPAGAEKKMPVPAVTEEVATFARPLLEEKYGSDPTTASVEVVRPLHEIVEFEPPTRVPRDAKPLKGPEKERVVVAILKTPVLLPPYKRFPEVTSVEVERPYQVRVLLEPPTRYPGEKVEKGPDAESVVVATDW